MLFSFVRIAQAASLPVSAASRNLSEKFSSASCRRLQASCLRPPDRRVSREIERQLEGRAAASPFLAAWQSSALQLLPFLHDRIDSGQVV